jgi:hypothetical protein
VINPAQLSPVSQVIFVVAAVLVIVEPQADVPAQETVHWVPAQAMEPAQELPWSHEMVQALALEQSTPPWHPEAPQVT